MTKYMKALAVMGPGKVAVVNDVLIPEVREYEALVRVRACGLCNGTDMQIINGTMAKEEGLGDYPTVLGHEGAGEVVEIGKKVRHIALGDRFIHPNLRLETGNGYTKTHGGFAQYGVVPDVQSMMEDGYDVNDIPELTGYGPYSYGYQEGPDAIGRFRKEIDFIDGAILLSLSESYSAVMNFGVCEGSEVLVYGCGPMGLSVMRFAKHLGAKNVTAIDALDERLEMAKRIGKADRTINFARQNVDEELNGQLFDIAIDVVGASSILMEASFRCKKNGTVGAMGVLKSNDSVLNVAHLKNTVRLQMLNFPYRQYQFQDELQQQIVDGKINPKDFYSHVMPLEKIETALELVRTKKSLKVILTID
ncbi:MAG: zinc-dependent alcohol dehydrogenase [Christensenellales bacterium]